MAINLSSEGLKVTVVDAALRPGGQAGTSSFIENYPGFPEGISGADLMSLFVDQALRFGTDFRMPLSVVEIEDGGPKIKTVVLDNNRRITCVSVVLAIGVSYRTLPAKNVAPYLGRGVHYGHPPLDSRTFEGRCVGVVGAGNNAGQAAHHLSQIRDCRVEILVRGNTLGAKMSDYLVQRLQSTGNININLQTEIVEVVGNGKSVQEVVLKTSEGESRMGLDDLFILIGAEPKTAWMDELVALDERNYVLTDRDIPDESWKEEDRRPFSMETSCPGIFAIGDVRSGNPSKRINTASGEGGQVANSVHRYRAFYQITNGTA